jgi:hypothetical protein
VNPTEEEMREVLKLKREILRGTKNAVLKVKSSAKDKLGQMALKFAMTSGLEQFALREAVDSLDRVLGTIEAEISATQPRK